MRITRKARRDARQLFRLCQVDALLDEQRALQLVQRIIQAKPRGYRSALCRFQRLVKLEYARRAANVESAIPLPHDLSAGIQDKLIRAYGPGLNFSFTEHPELIGGMRIAVGSDVYDGSIQARLCALAEYF